MLGCWTVECENLFGAWTELVDSMPEVLNKCVALVVGYGTLSMVDGGLQKWLLVTRL